MGSFGHTGMESKAFCRSSRRPTKCSLRAFALPRAWRRRQRSCLASPTPRCPAIDGRCCVCRRALLLARRLVVRHGALVLGKSRGWRALDGQQERPRWVCDRRSEDRGATFWRGGPALGRRPRGAVRLHCDLDSVRVDLEEGLRPGSPMAPLMDHERLSPRYLLDSTSSLSIPASARISST